MIFQASQDRFDSGGETAEPEEQRFCVVCATRQKVLEANRVRSNVRRFKHESFLVWRCAGCRSLHAWDDVDLSRYYAGYPIFGAALDWRLRVVYDNMLARLRRAGLRSEHALLDYGCGAGLLVQHLKNRGYARASGYDRFAQGMDRRELLEDRYDAVVCQDVLEHVEDPIDLLATIDRLVKSGGFVALGTPDADALDLMNHGQDVHALHQPYHRHILTADMLRAKGEALGWTVEHHYSTMFNNTLFPTMNPRFVLHYVKCHDDVFDLVAEPIKLSGWKIWSPATPFFALFGYFLDRHTDIMVIFRKP
ncbi:MAG: class I SAM-dependent methyltransferase [Myxococcales bacterium]|nr:class I SAM-dependent methyltransferase [Myxococcales bacterium]